MSNKTRSILRLVSILLILVPVLHRLDIILIPALADYMFWMVVAASGILLLTSR